VNCVLILSDFLNLVIYLHFFFLGGGGIPDIKFHKYLSLGNRIHPFPQTDGQTYMITKLIVIFRSYFM
jgi:hypothetical protein